MKNWQKWMGISACILLIISCFLKWCYYPDINEYFTGFYSFNNRYGKPGKFLVVAAIICLVLHWLPKPAAKGANLAIAAICTAYAVTKFYVFTGANDGTLPIKQFGIWLMIFAVAINLIATVTAQSYDQKK